MVSTISFITQTSPAFISGRLILFSGNIEVIVPSRTRNRQLQLPILQAMIRQFFFEMSFVYFSSVDQTQAVSKLIIFILCGCRFLVTYIN